VSSNPDFDRWYAARQVKILLSPTSSLETFGNTLVNYHLVSELEDHPGKIRVREGRLEALRPLVITPNFNEITAEGFGEEAKAYLEFLKENEENLRILRYGFHLKTDKFSEQIITGSMEMVTEQVLTEVRAKDDGLSAVLQGVDSPWDVAIVELWRREVERSASKNIRELHDSGKLFNGE
jgi:hypothetical protein